MAYERFVYLISIFPPFLIWAVFFFKRKDLRQEMVVMSSITGFLAVFFSYYFWTVDWWRPLNMTATRIGVEDFIAGFIAGGIVAVIYEVLFKRELHKRKIHHHTNGAFTLILLLASTLLFLFYGVGLTSFWATAIAFKLVAVIMLFMRKDLFINAVLSGILMMIVSLASYYLIMLVSPGWMDATYLPTLSGILVTGIPLEELIFWFLAGCVFGPFYEYWQGEKLKKLARS